MYGAACKNVRRWVARIMLAAMAAFTLNGAAFALFQASSGPPVGMSVWHGHSDEAGHTHFHDVPSDGDHDHQGKLPCASPAVAALPTPAAMPAALSVASEALIPALDRVRGGTDVSGQKPPPRTPDIA